MLAIAETCIPDCQAGRLHPRRREGDKAQSIESLFSSQFSRAAAFMDAELEAWRTRRLGAFPQLVLPLPVLGARYEKVRIDGVVRDAAILSAIEGQ
jgi:transposase-like protein